MVEKIPLKQKYLKVVKLGSYMKQKTSKWRSHVHWCFIQKKRNTFVGYFTQTFNSLTLIGDL